MPSLNEYRRPRPRFLIFLGVLLVFAVGYLVGLATAPSAQTQDIGSLLRDAFGANRYEKNVKLIQSVLDEIETNYLNQPIDQQRLVYGALEGMVKSLGDPYSVFLTPIETDKFQEVVEGSFEGIGAEIGIRDDRATIIAPLKKSPAEQAGVQAGDLIISIDDASADTLTLDEVVAKLRGPKGTKVTIVVLHPDTTEPQTIVITRDTIHLDSVESQKLQTADGDSVAYVQVNTFTGSTDTEFADVLRTAALDQPQGYIIDLRNNPGGYLDSAISMLGHFVGTQVAVIEEFNDGKQLPHHSNGSAELADTPVVVLVDGGSASAAEIFAGALQDYSLATIIGTQTFGKGTVQNYEQLDDGSSLKITVARWLTPEGKTIDGTGITPDQVVERSDDGDPQLDAALAAIVSACCSE